jgi:hypothetical protein
MPKYDDLKTRIRALLEDENARRFSDALLAAALRRALDDLELQLPNIAELEWTAVTAGRDQPLPALTGCRYIICVTLPESNAAEQVLKPEEHFTYFLKDGVPTLHFNGSYIPQAGAALMVRCASGYAIEGFEGEGATTLPAAFESALVNGTAAEACILRAGSIAERSGVHPSEVSRLLEIGHLWRETFARNLSGLKVLQDFGFPAGFALDRWDGRTQ